MPRDNFSQHTKEMLGKAVGFQCVRPGCAKPTTAFNPNSGAMSYIGTAAHDSAASPGGPRYNDELTPEQRRAMENGAHLCPTCARVVDVDPNRFPAGMLSSWQREASEYRQRGMLNPYPPSGLNFKASCEAAQKFIAACRNIQIDHWGKSASWTSLCAMKELLRISLPMAATNPLCAQFPHMVNLQLEMLKTIRLVINEIESSGCWFYNSYCSAHFLHEKQTVFPTPKELHTNTCIDNSSALVLTRMRDFYDNRDKLNAIAMSPYPTQDLYGW